MFVVNYTAGFEENRFLSFMAFLCFCLDGIEMLVDDLTLNQDDFELCLVLLVDCEKDK